MKNRFFHSGFWSLVVPLVPLVAAGWIIICILKGRGGGESGLAAIATLAIVAYYLVLITIVTSTAGTLLAVWALYRGKKKTGTVGLVLNVIFLSASVSLITLNYYKVYSNPDRLNIAVMQGDTKAVRRMLKRGFDINHKFYRNETPLQTGISNPDMVKLLIAYGADVNARDGDGRTPLHYLASSGVKDAAAAESKQATIEIADLLIGHGADIEAKSCDGSTPLHAAADADNIVMIEKLMAEGAKVNAVSNYRQTPVIFASKKGNFEAARMLIAEGANLNIAPESGYGLLIEAIESGNIQWVDFLLKAGADPNVVDTGGLSAVHHALRSFWDVKNKKRINTEILELLLNAGADVNTADPFGDTPLHIAAGNADQIRLLMNKGADVNAKNRQGLTPLYVTLLECEPGTGQQKAAQMLLDNGASMNVVCGQGGRNTPLYLVRGWRPATEQQKKYREEMIALMELYNQKEQTTNAGN